MGRENYIVPTLVLDRVLRIRKRHLDAIDKTREGNQECRPFVEKCFGDATALLREHGYTRAQAEMTFTAIKKATH